MQSGQPGPQLGKGLFLICSPIEGMHVLAWILVTPNTNSCCK